VRDASLARDTLSALFGDVAMCTSDQAKKLLAQRRRDLCLQDPTFTIELGVLATLFEGGGSSCCLRKAILQVLPPYATCRDPVAGLQKMQALRSQMVFKLATRSSQQHLGVVCGWLQVVQEERELKVASCAADPFLKQVISGLIGYCAFVDGEQTLRGMEALKGHLAAAKNAEAKGVVVQPMLSPLVCWAWWLDEAEKAVVARMQTALKDSASECLKAVAATKGEGPQGQAVIPESGPGVIPILGPHSE
jgi:hypothetical protein